MHAEDTAFGFLRNPSKYVIPYFQRSYVWELDNWKELLENLKDSNRSHFLGSIILKSKDNVSGQVPSWSVIDGQQRLTTLSILFRACCDVLLSLPEISANQNTKNKINTQIDNFLFFTESSLDAIPEIKIKHSRVDNAAYEEIINGKKAANISDIVLDSEADKNNPASCRIFQCYKYFFNELSNDTGLAQRIFEFLNNDANKILVKIDLSSQENEQAIFDTINSAGVRLSSSDIIKNALFQKAIENAKTDAERINVEAKYKKCWEDVFLGDDNSIEFWNTERKIGRLKRDNLELLLYCIALIKKFFDPYKNTMSQLVDVYKENIKVFSSGALNNFLDEIDVYAELYRKWFTKPESNTYYTYNNPIQRILHILSVSDLTTFQPYILKLIKDYNVTDENNLPEEFVTEIEKLESYIMRHIACNENTGNFNKVCFLLIDGKTTLEDQFAEKDSLIDDISLRKRLQFIPSNRYAALILFWIELYRHFSDKKYGTNGLTYSYQLEHLMPQKWTDNWGVNAVPVVDANTGKIISDPTEATEARNSAVYEIGNMTLLNGKLNASISNKDMSKKINGDGTKKGIDAYNDLSLTKNFLANYQKNQVWNEKEIRIRTNELVDEFVKIWKWVK